MNCIYYCSIAFDVLLVIAIHDDENIFIQTFKQNLVIKAKNKFSQIDSIYNCGIAFDVLLIIVIHGDGKFSYSN